MPGRTCALAILLTAVISHPSAQSAIAPATGRFNEPRLSIGAGDCTAARLGGSIPPSAIGEPVSSVTLSLPTGYERFALLVDWVERRIAPGKSVTLTGDGRTWPLCSYPQFPKYVGGQAPAAASFRCADR